MTNQLLNIFQNNDLSLQKAIDQGIATFYPVNTANSITGNENYIPFIIEGIQEEKLSIKIDNPRHVLESGDQITYSSIVHPKILTISGHTSEYVRTISATQNLLSDFQKRAGILNQYTTIANPMVNTINKGVKKALGIANRVDRLIKDSKTFTASLNKSSPKTKMTQVLAYLRAMEKRAFQINAFGCNFNAGFRNSPTLLTKTKTKPMDLFRKKILKNFISNQNSSIEEDVFYNTLWLLQTADVYSDHAKKNGMVKVTLVLEECLIGQKSRATRVANNSAMSKSIRVPIKF